MAAIIILLASGIYLYIQAVKSGSDAQANKSGAKPYDFVTTGTVKEASSTFGPYWAITLDPLENVNKNVPQSKAPLGASLTCEKATAEYPCYRDPKLKSGDAVTVKGWDVSTTQSLVGSLEVR